MTDQFEFSQGIGAKAGNIKFYSSYNICFFSKTHQDEMIKIIKELARNKASPFKDIPVKIMVNSIHVYSHALTKIFNDYVKSGSFPDILK